MGDGQKNDGLYNWRQVHRVGERQEMRSRGLGPEYAGLTGPVEGLNFILKATASP